MTDRALEATPRAPADRVVAVALAIGLAALFGAAALLWWREGAQVFVDVILAGLSACF